MRTRNEIQEEVSKLNERLREIKKDDRGLFTTENIMEKASITVRLAAMWDEWQAAEWEWSK